MHRPKSLSSEPRRSRGEEPAVPRPPKQVSTTPQPEAQPHLIRALGRRDLVLLFVVTVWLWIISLLLFFWPQGIAVIELAHRYPGEGGVYLWAKEVFGDFHGFLSG